MAILKDHCLFCLERKVPYQITSNSNNETDKAIDKQPSLHNFHRLCDYLSISLPKKNVSKTRGKLASSSKNAEIVPKESTCDTLLCLQCFEMVDQLDSLYRDYQELQRRIGEAELKIKQVIIDNEIISKLGDAKGFKNLDGGDLEFITLFHDLVKGRGEGKAKRKKLRDKEEEITLGETVVLQQLTKNVSRGAPRAKAEAEVHVERVVKTEIKEGLLQSDDDFLGDWSNDGGESSNHSYANPKLDTDVDWMKQNDSKSKDDQGRVEEKDGDSDLDSNDNYKNQDDDDWIPKCKKRKISSKRKNFIRKAKSTAISSFSSSKKRSGPRVKKEQSSLNVKCLYCDKSFENYMKQWIHVKQEHPEMQLNALKETAASLGIPTSKKVSTTNKRARFYECTICGADVKEVTYKFVNYMEHMLSHEPSEIPNKDELYSCPDCDKQFVLKINLDLHKACFHDTRQILIKCVYCERKTFQSGEELVEHLKANHGDNVHSCRHCPMSFISFEEVLIHMQKHSKRKNLECPECGYVTATIKDLARHCHQQHKELKETYPCTLCDKVYLLPKNLKIHMLAQHPASSATSQQTNLTCPQCYPKNKKTIYKTEFALRRHVTNVHNRPKSLMCDKCNNCFYTIQSLKLHIERVHEKIKYPCPHCGNSYSDQNYLAQHIKLHEVEKEDLPTCKVCNKQYSSILHLKRHLKTHEVDRPEDRQVCEVCGKEFSNDTKLRRHKLITHPKKLVKCDFCNYEFKRPSHLKTHMRIHTKERAYVCPFCKKDFNRRDILRVHISGVHKLTPQEAKQAVDTMMNKVD